MKKIFALFSLTILSAAMILPTVITSAQRSPAGRAVIVTFKDDAPLQGFIYQDDERVRANPRAWGYHDRSVLAAVQAFEVRNNFMADRVYSAALRGFAARLTDEQIQRLEEDPMVAYVENDGIAYANAQTLPWGINKIDADLSSALAGNGSGVISNVNVYVIDSGVDTTHPDLNVVNFVNFAGGSNADCNGHGTHVAGTIAAKDDTNYVVGVAPGAPVTAVKVLGCSGSGSWSGIISGIDWVTANARKPAVANMSLGGGANTAVDDAVRRSASSGIFYALAAGNEGVDACTTSPARAGAGTNNGIVTVAATDSSDREASWSNYGQCVDIWAPGVSILSTKKGGTTTTMSGTSMASPHVAGGGALYLSKLGSAGPSTVEAALKSAATTTANKSKDGRTITRQNVAGF